ncbi:hypothetical protein QYM36_016596 [Artemia franciscana]|uniref:Uncharacterized protein n=1 Tax=Artemia franciscana TaxID=6661 RepID=A0AA88L3L5_ARTSF|nr:hypothetical protein QYM36_016596 [Artemia franciscana]
MIMRARGLEYLQQYFIESIQTKEEKNNELVAKLHLTKEGINVEFKIDTVAEANVILMKTLNKMPPQPKLRPTSDILTSYTGESLKVAGTCQLDGQYKNREPQTHKFYVVDTDKRPIPSRQTSVSLNLIKFIYNIEKTPVTSTMDEILAKYKDVFEGIGQTEKRTGTTGIPRDNRKVTEPTELVNSMVVVQKPDSDIRICLDPVELNK